MKRRNARRKHTKTALNMIDALETIRLPTTKSNNDAMPLLLFFLVLDMLKS